MPTEPSFAQRQKLAFGYLRERACRFHLEGDGLQVNSLCAVALAQVERLANEGKLLITLAEVRWCYAFALYWLIDEYMLRAIHRGLLALDKAGRSEQWIHNLINECHILVTQPLANLSSSFTTLAGIQLTELGEANQCEDLVLLTNTVELVWFRSTRDSAWAAVLDKWSTSCPAWCKKPLEQLKSRLQLQTRLTAPNPQFPPVPQDFVKSKVKGFDLAGLWIQLLYCDGKAIDQVIEKLNAVSEPDSHVARLLFDAHHCNRYAGNFGEPQEVGLARRRLLVSSSPLHTFNELREARLSEQFGEIVRRSEVGAASTRFHVFTLAMLCEIAALRLWDFYAWCEAVKAQSEAYLEASKWQQPPAMAAFGIHLAYQSLSYTSVSKDSLIRNAITRLEFAPVEVLFELGEWLQVPYPRQKTYAYAALGDLSDLIPPIHWPKLAQWTIRYLEERRQGKHFRDSINPLAEWSHILPFVEDASEIWKLFLAEVIILARNPLAWRFSDDFLHIWLTKAPIEFAQQVGLEMLSIEHLGAEERICRANILFNVEKARREFAGKFTPRLVKLASGPIELIFLNGSEEPAVRASAKDKYKESLQSFINSAVPPDGSTQWNMGFISNALIDLLDWNVEDMPLVENIVKAIDDPNVMSNSIFNLLLCLATLVLKGPKDFADFVFPRFCVWLNHLPVGRIATTDLRGPFAVTQFSDSTQHEAIKMLGWLAFQMRHKLGTVVDPFILAWLERSVLTPQPRAIPIMLYTAIPAITSSNERAKADLLTTCQALLLHLLARHESDPEAGACLSNALTYLGMILAREDGLVQWNTDAGKMALEEFIKKFGPMFVVCGRSTNPDVRASIAQLMRNMKEWCKLSSELECTLQLLTKDNRARVRKSAL